MEMKFSDLEFKPHRFDHGIHAKHEFDNGYGVSVVQFNITLLSGEVVQGSYGSLDGLYEVAVTKGGKPYYESPITDGVIGYCDESEVEHIMEQVAKL
jgi:hypothetical protein